MENIYTPNELRTLISNEQDFCRLKEEKAFSITKLQNAFRQYLIANIVKKRKKPPYEFKILIIYHDLDHLYLVDKLIEFAQTIEKSNWFVNLKTDKRFDLPKDIVHNCKIVLCQENNLPPKYCIAQYHFSDIPIEKNRLDKITYRTPIKPVLKRSTSIYKLSIKSKNPIN